MEKKLNIKEKNIITIQNPLYLDKLIKKGNIIIRMKIGKQQQYIQIILQIITKIQYIKLKSYIKNQIFIQIRTKKIYLLFLKEIYPQ